MCKLTLKIGLLLTLTSYSLTALTLTLPNFDLFQIANFNLPNFGIFSNPDFNFRVQLYSNPACWNEFETLFSAFLE